MAQKLILEGNEGYVLSEILKLSYSRLPLGYPTTKEYVEEFLESVKSVNNVKPALIEYIETPDITNVGIIVDANSKGTKARFHSIKSTLNQYLPAVENWNFVANAPSGWVADVTPGFRIGLWVMPNNQDNGYFEHFLAQLIDPADASFQAAQEMLAFIQAGQDQRFPDLRAQKALLALYLAIQEEPGMSPVTALRKGLLSHKHPLAQHFVSWYEQTFALESA